MNLQSKRDLKLFVKSEILGFTGSVFKQMFLKSSRQAPAATAWEKKKEVREQHKTFTINTKTNTKTNKNT